jgi:acetyl-CoA hydrolase
MTVEYGDIADLDLARHIRSGDTVLWGQACAEPVSLTEALVRQRAALGRVRCFLGIPCTATMRPEHGDHLSFVSYSAAGANRELHQAGVLDVLPCHYSDLPRVLGEGPLRADVILLALPPAGPDGRFGLGLCADYVAAVIGRARVVIAEVSDQVPRIGGCPTLARDEIDVIVRTSRRPPEHPAAAPKGVEAAIAARVAGLVEDGATVQFGVGGMPSAVLSGLGDRRDLGVHSGMISDAIVPLAEAGVITGARKSVDPGLIVTGFLLGTRTLFGYAAASPAVRLRDTRYTHDPAVLAAQHRLVAINTATEVDLTGQVNTETAGGRYVGAVGGAADFLRGAARSAGGVPIVALPSTAGPVSRIVARLTGPVSVPRSDAGVIVTEHGVADLRGLTVRERQDAMLAVADPGHRPALEAALAAGPQQRQERT